MGKFAVIDTETNWSDRVMSIGCCVADADTFSVISTKYQVLTPECLVGGMFSSTLFAGSRIEPTLCSREEALAELTDWFRAQGVRDLFAYNACFDRSHLPELGGFNWYDIMRLAAYRQYNAKIPATANCCATGRLKQGYGVEAMLRLLSGDRTYHESHNALTDALDELEIMRLLGHGLGDYRKL